MEETMADTMEQRPPFDPRTGVGWFAAEAEGRTFFGYGGGYVLVAGADWLDVVEPESEETELLFNVEQAVQLTPLTESQAHGMIRQVREAHAQAQARAQSGLLVPDRAGAVH